MLMLNKTNMEIYVPCYPWSIYYQLQQTRSSRDNDLIHTLEKYLI